MNIDAPYNLQYYKAGDYNSYVATMGCADGDEIVAYKYRGEYHCEGLKRLWNRIQAETLQNGISEYKIPGDLEVWDGDNGFVAVKTVIKNPDVGNWVRVKFSDGRVITVTEDHPLYTENRGRIHVNELKIGDTIKTYVNMPEQPAEDSIKNVGLGYLLGLMFKKADFSPRGISMNFYGRNKIIMLNKFTRLAKDILNFDFHTRPNIENTANNIIRVFSEQIEADNYFRLIFSVNQKDDGRPNRLLGHIRDDSRIIPQKIFTAAHEVRLAFLAGMIDADSKINRYSRIEIHMHHKETALQLAALVNSLGYFAEIYLNQFYKGTQEENSYNVVFSMSDEISQYLDHYQKEHLLPQYVMKTTLKPPTIVEVKSIEYLGALNKCSYDLETASDKFTLSFINSGNCRTRVMSNVNGPEQSGSRGNFSFVTINLPKLALESNGNIDEFFRLYDKYITISHDYLLFRLKTIEEKHVYNYPFLMGQGVWLDAEKLKLTDTIKEVLKHASYSIGFCGLAECLVALIGKHHGQSAEAQELGLKIVKHLRERTDEYTRLEHRNWTTFATPAESTAGQFQRANRKKYGRIKGVTDRDYMTNSSHVPVYFPICVNDKINIEAPYHSLENAGHIAYIEMDGDPTKNLSAFEAIVRAMHDAGMGYFSINHPVDRDPVCGYTGVIANECPHCHRKEITRGTFHIDRMK